MGSTSFINLNLVSKHTIVFIKKCANLVKHTPGCLVSYAKLSLNFFGRYAAPGGGHSLNNLEPCFKRRRGLMKYCTSRRVHMVSAIITRIARMLGNLMMFCNLLAGRAFNAIRKSLILKPFQARIIINKFPIKIIDCISLHFTFHVLPLIQSVYHINYLLSRDSYLNNLV